MKTKTSKTLAKNFFAILVLCKQTTLKKRHTHSIPACTTDLCLKGDEFLLDRDLEYLYLKTTALTLVFKVHLTTLNNFFSGQINPYTFSFPA